MKKICILGSGYIGRYLYNYLSNKLNKKTKVYILSIRKLTDLNLGSYDYVIDSADRSSGVHNSLINNKLQIIRENKKDSYNYIYFSSTSIYNNNSNKIDETSQINPNNEYQINKAKNEKFILENKKKSFILRLSNIWSIQSPRGSFIGDQVYKIQNRIPIEINDSDFKSYIDLVHIKDLSNIVYNIISNKIEQNLILNICSGYSMQVAYIKNKMVKKQLIKDFSKEQFKRNFSTKNISNIGLKIPLRFCYYYNKYIKLLKDIK